VGEEKQKVDHTVLHKVLFFIIYKNNKIFNILFDCNLPTYSFNITSLCSITVFLIMGSNIGKFLTVSNFEPTHRLYGDLLVLESDFIILFWIQVRIKWDGTQDPFRTGWNEVFHFGIGDPWPGFQGKGSQARDWLKSCKEAQQICRYYDHRLSLRFW